MAFVNEWITHEDIALYQMHEDWKITRRPFEVIDGHDCYIHGAFPNLNLDVYLDVDFEVKSDFTIDRERVCYLRHGGSGNPAMGVMGESYYMLYWQGHRTYIAITRKKTQETDQANLIAYMQINLVQVYLPDALTDQKDEVLQLFKEAMDVYGESGGYSRYTYHQTYSF